MMNKQAINSAAFERNILNFIKKNKTQGFRSSHSLGGALLGGGIGAGVGAVDTAMSDVPEDQKAHEYFKNMATMGGVGALIGGGLGYNKGRKIRNAVAEKELFHLKPTINTELERISGMATPQARDIARDEFRTKLHSMVPNNTAEEYAASGRNIFKENKVHRDNEAESLKIKSRQEKDKAYNEYQEKSRQMRAAQEQAAEESRAAKAVAKEQKAQAKAKSEEEYYATSAKMKRDLEERVAQEDKLSKTRVKRDDGIAHTGKPDQITPEGVDLGAGVLTNEVDTMRRPSDSGAVNTRKSGLHYKQLRKKLGFPPSPEEQHNLDIEKALRSKATAEASVAERAMPLKGPKPRPSALEKELTQAKAEMATHQNLMNVDTMNPAHLKNYQEAAKKTQRLARMHEIVATPGYESNPGLLNELRSLNPSTAPKAGIGAGLEERARHYQSKVDELNSSFAGGNNDRDMVAALIGNREKADSINKIHSEVSRLEALKSDLASKYEATRDVAHLKQMQTVDQDIKKQYVLADSLENPKPTQKNKKRTRTAPLPRRGRGGRP